MKHQLREGTKTPSSKVEARETHQLAECRISVVSRGTESIVVEFVRQ